MVSWSLSSGSGIRGVLSGLERLEVLLIVARPEEANAETTELTIDGATPGPVGRSACIRFFVVLVTGDHDEVHVFLAYSIGCC